MATQFNSPKRFVAYFSMEIALENAMPSYSGGLGGLAGDTHPAGAGICPPVGGGSLFFLQRNFLPRALGGGTQTGEAAAARPREVLPAGGGRGAAPLGKP